MTPPRMAVGVIRGDDQREPIPLAEGLQQVGHTVNVTDVEGAAEFEAVILSGSDAAIVRHAEAAVARVRPGQIFIHTSLSLRIDELFMLTEAQAVVCSIYRVSASHWIISGDGQLGDAVADLLVKEMGALPIRVEDSARGPLSAAMSYARLAAEVSQEAQELLRRATGLEEVPFVDNDAAEVRAMLDVQALDKSHEALVDPGVRRSFVGLARRAAERHGVDDAELWTMRQNLRP